jgi:hypothetical protein
VSSHDPLLGTRVDGAIPTQVSESVRPVRVPVRVVEGANATTFQNLKEHNVPSVLRVRDCARWDIERLRELFGGTPVPVARGLPAKGNVFQPRSASVRSLVPWVQFVTELVSDAETVSYLTVPLFSSDEGINPHLPRDSVSAFASTLPYGVLGVSSVAGAQLHLWLGTKGTRSGWHFDSRDNLFFQCFGRKHVLLADPRASRNMYPRRGHHYNSQVDADDPDLLAYPRYSDAVLYQCMLAPGDTLFIPKGWWHSLRSVTSSGSTSYFWGEALPAAHHLQIIALAGPPNWIRCAIDFCTHGLLRAPYRREPYSGDSSGEWLYKTLVAKVARCNKAGRHARDAALPTTSTRATNRLREFMKRSVKIAPDGSQ